ncbi:MAG: diacylglycerol kinase family protein [Anaerolineales bacterium]|jgi:diacylglycerol kinase
MNKIREFFVSRAHSFEHAFHGWWYVLRTQRNAWIHAAISLAVVLLAIWLRLPLRDWAVLVLTIALVWGAEFINTALEAVVDLVNPQQHPLAKVGKDVAAAAVLLAALASILVGLLILGPPLWEKLKFLFAR